MKKIFAGIGSLAVVCVLLNGCGQGDFDRSAFRAAPPDVKQTWERALAASQADDYLGANTNLVSLLGRGITPDQLVAVQNALSALNARMYAAAAKGDESARKAVEALKAMQPPNRTRAGVSH